MKESEIRARLGEIADEAQTIIEAQRRFSENGVGRQSQFDSNSERLEALTVEREGLEVKLARFERIAELAKNPANLVSGVDPNGRTEIPQKRSDAYRAVEQNDRLTDDAKERVVSMLDRDPAELTPAARWAKAASDPEYASAFRKVLFHGPQDAVLAFTDREREAFATAKTVQRNMVIGTDADGGFMLPVHLDPSVLLSSDGSISSLRQVARVETIATDTWNGISSAGVTAEWLAEAAEAADATPTLAQPSIPVHKGSAFVPFSIEWQQDALQGERELARLLVDGADQLQAEAYVTGSGSGQPTGIVTGLDAVAGSEKAAAGATIASGDVYALLEDVPPRFRARASWLASLSVQNALSQEETANGARLFPSIDNGQLLQKRIYEESFMDADGASSNVLIAGDIARTFVIVDRVGTSIEIVPHLFGANRRPTGERGAFMHFRTGSDVVVAEASRLLQTTAT